MSIKDTYSIYVLGPTKLKGCWPIRFFHKHLIHAILAENYLIVDYPMKILCTINMDSTTIISQKQKIIFLDAKLTSGKLSYKKIQISNIDKHIETFTITKNECIYNGFFGIDNIESFRIVLSQSFNMHNMITVLIETVEQIKDTFETQTNISALDILKKIMQTLQINLNDIIFLNLSNFLKIKNGEIVYAKKFLILLL